MSQWTRQPFLPRRITLRCSKVTVSTVKHLTACGWISLYHIFHRSPWTISPRLSVIPNCSSLRLAEGGSAAHCSATYSTAKSRLISLAVFSSFALWTNRYSSPVQALHRLTITAISVTAAAQKLVSRLLASSVVLSHVPSRCVHKKYQNGSTYYM